MSELDKKEIAIQMQEKLLKLEKEIDTLKDLTQPISPDCAIGRVSRMDAINNKSVNEAALQKKQVQASALQESLQHIDSDDFGKCITCGKQIPVGRIMIVPESKKCVACANK